MKRLLAAGWAAVLFGAACASGADLVVQRWGDGGALAHPGTMKITDDGTVAFDLSALPASPGVLRARLYCFRAEMDNNADEAIVEPVVVVAGTDRALPLVGPWYDCFDVPPQALKPGTSLTLEVRALPAWQKERTFLEIAYRGQAAGAQAPAGGPPTVKDLQAVHHDGQTFLSWRQAEKVLDKDRPTWAEVRAAQDQAVKEGSDRYRVYASDKPITPETLESATLLGEVGPLSAWNVNGRSADQAFVIMRKRMLEDMDFAKGVSKDWYGIPRSCHDAVEIDRFVIPRSKDALPADAGLYVHQPGKAGKSFYAVTVIHRGAENTATLRAGANVVGPVDETVGPGGLVFQRVLDMKVLFDYPGRREQYVQWTAPPLSNLPNQYYNWGVFVPDGLRPEDRPYPMEVVLTGNDMFRRPRWPHRLDTILLSPQDAPFSTWYFGYPDSQGTLKGLKGVTIHPYTWRRMRAGIEWMVKRYDVLFGRTDPCIDRNRITCSGDRGCSATGALHFAMRNPDLFSLVYTCKGMPNPAALPAARGDGGRPRPTAAGELERLIGRREWRLKTDTGQDAWEFFNLTAEVSANPKVLRPMLSYGGRGQWDWPPIAEFLKALAAARQPVISEGTWGAVDPPGLKNPGGRRYGLDVRLDRPIPIFANCSSDYQGGRNGDGGQTNMGLWWEYEGITDEPGRFEIVLAGGATADVTIRRTAKFLPKPGEKVDFKIELAGPANPFHKFTPRDGSVLTEDNGLVTIPKVDVYARTRLTLTRSMP